jgi:hypothetical protein
MAIFQTKQKPLSQLPLILYFLINSKIQSKTLPNKFYFEISGAS